MQQIGIVPHPDIKPSTNMRIPTIAVISIIPVLGLLSSCKEKGPAEEAGEKLDEAIEDVKDKVDPQGPAERVGEKVDDALGE